MNPSHLRRNRSLGINQRIEHADDAKLFIQNHDRNFHYPVTLSGRQSCCFHVKHSEQSHDHLSIRIAVRWILRPLRLNCPEAYVIWGGRKTQLAMGLTLAVDPVGIQVKAQKNALSKWNDCFFTFGPHAFHGVAIRILDGSAASRVS